MKVALVYDRINKWGGAERVLLAFHHLFPNATWYTSLWDPTIATFSKDWDVRTSLLNNLPFLRTHHEWIPYLMPFIFESFSFSDYDLVISISSEAAKGVITKPSTTHLNYCLTPTRYLYSHQQTYLSNPIYRFIANLLRPWDQVASTRPDEMIAISTSVKNRVQKYYKRSLEVIFPPVDTEKFSFANSKLKAESYYLVVSRLVPYKQIDVIVKAFNSLPDKKLVIIGMGTEQSRLRRLSKNNTTFVGPVNEQDLVSYYSGCKALIQANIEDFGLSMVEAGACGVPVLARRGGGALDIIDDGITGLLYDGQGPQALISAIAEFETMHFSREVCQQNARRFDTHVWEQQIMERITTLCQTT